MYRQEEIKPYDGQGEKSVLVEEMFDDIAPKYDMLNHRLSWNIDKGWRKKAIEQLSPFQPKNILDIATGTGDFSILATKMLKPDHLIGADISEGMMEIGRQKVKCLGLNQVIEMCRVLKKGGHLSVAELTSPVSFPMKQLFKLYSHTLLPAYGAFVTKNRGAYDYLTATIEAFPQGEKMMEILKEAGFSKVSFRRLTLGVCTIYFAQK